MKNILTAAIISVTCIAHAQQTLTIIDQDYELAKQTALQQQKLLIIDFYTTWCVPCKMLDKAIFKNDSMAAEINKDFVVLQYDAERDSVHNLSLKYHVSSYPTTIVLTGDGRLVHKMFGTGGTEALLANYSRLLRESILLNKQGKYIEGVSTKIDPDLYPGFYKKYVRRIANIKPGDLSNYWSDNKDLQSEVSLDILAYFGDAPEHVINYFIRHKPEYEKRYGKADVKFIMDRIVSDKFRAAITAKDESGYEAAIKFAKQQLPPGDAHEYIKTYSLEMYIAKRAWSKAMDLIEKQIHQKDISENRINYFCWIVYEECQDKKIIANAARLMKDITDINPLFATLDTYARLLSRNGSRAEAIAAMERAIAIGKANGEDTKESEAALSKF